MHTIYKSKSIHSTIQGRKLRRERLESEAEDPIKKIKERGSVNDYMKANPK